MIFSMEQGYVPESYYESRDYRVFLKLFGAVASVFKSNIDSFPGLYDPDNCPDNLLPLLANLVGYDYNDGVTIEGNRTIIKYFPYLIRYRGSEEGIKLAVVLTANTTPGIDGEYTLDNIIVEFDYETGLIKIYCPSKEPLRKDLLEVVRPVGTFIEMISPFISRNTEEFDIKTTVRARVEEYDKDREKVDRSKVGFGNTNINVEEGDKS